MLCHAWAPHDKCRHTCTRIFGSYMYMYTVIYMYMYAFNSFLKLFKSVRQRYAGTLNASPVAAMLQVIEMFCDC